MTIFRPPNHIYMLCDVLSFYASVCRIIYTVLYVHIYEHMCGGRHWASVLRCIKITFIFCETRSISGQSFNRSLGWLIKKHWELAYLCHFRAGLQAQTNIPFYVSWVWGSNSDPRFASQEFSTGHFSDSSYFFSLMYPGG